MIATTRRATYAVALAAAVGASLAACADAPRATPTTPTVTVTSTAPPSTAPSSTTTERSPGSTMGEPAGGSGDAIVSGASSADGCAPDIGFTAAASRDGARIASSSDSRRWTPYNAGGTWCPGLSWVEVQGYSEGGPVRPHQLLIYHDGHFQGTGIRCEARWGQYVQGTSADAVTVTYSFPDVSIPEQSRKQDPLGRATVTFRWDGSQIVMDGSLPNAFTEGRC